MPERNGNNGSSEHETRLIAGARDEAARLAEARAASVLPPDAVPGYRIVREIGRGGMGVVYEMEQQEPRRAVALKVMRAGGTMDRHRLMLFRQEVHTLARLNHPNIAAIYEAGRTDDGRHFFAMELVRGVRLTEHVRLEQLPRRAVLELFCRVCEAVHYAHQRGVIHRDLKPSNIVVDADGNPKILDFGLARISDAKGAPGVAPGEAGKIMGTLPYMSPEQIRGRPDELDIRTDVYSLGVVLYELLTDHLPHDLGHKNHDEVRDTICNAAPRPPSMFARSLRGDLELIILKALEKDPANRYQSAAALGEDIRRYLGGYPVLARPENALYHFRKFVMRHKVLSAYVTTVVAVALLFAVWINALAADARQRELDNLQRLRDVEEWRRKFQAEQKGKQLAAASELADRLEELARSLMNSDDYDAAERILRMCVDLRDDRADVERWVLAYTRSLLGECLLAQGHVVAAQPLLQESYAVLRDHYGPTHEVTEAAGQRVAAWYAAVGRPAEYYEWRASFDVQPPAATRPTP